MLKKQFYKTKDTCKITFEFGKEVEEKLGEPITRVSVVGDFNNWDNSATPMKKLKGGTWRTQLVLEKEKEYQFRYLINGAVWENDWGADRYVPNAVDGDNSVLETYVPAD